MSKLVTTTVRKAYYAVATEKDGKLTWGPVKYWPGLRELGVSVKEEIGKVYAEGMLWAMAKALGDIDVNLEFTDIPEFVYTDIYGKKRGTMGEVLDNAHDVAPYICIMAEKELTEGVMEYCTLFKGKMNLPDDKSKTNEGKVDFQTKPTNAVFMPLDDGLWRSWVRSDNPDFQKDKWAEKWGKEVMIPEIKKAA